MLLLLLLLPDASSHLTPPSLLAGYEGLRNSLGSTKPAKAAAVVTEDRIFSGSSVKNTAGATQTR